MAQAARALNITLEELHYAVNEAMGWTNSHLHQFLLGDRCFSDKTMPDAEVHDFEDERTVHLGSLLTEGDTIGYEYDFGDGWSHRVKVEKALKFDGRLAYPLCIGGARACPPEDCGGPGGYEDFLKALRNKKNPRHNELTTWIGGHFDPESFDVNRTNAALRERFHR